MQTRHVHAFLVLVEVHHGEQTVRVTNPNLELVLALSKGTITHAVLVIHIYRHNF